MILIARAAPVMWVGFDPAHLTAAAVLLLPLYAMRVARRDGLGARSMYWGALAALFGALLGGRAFILLFHDSHDRLSDWLQFWSGGTSSLGALAGAALAGAAYTHLRRLPLAEYADAIVPAALLAYALARVGCLLNGDDFGITTAVPWAVRYAPGSLVYADHLHRGFIDANASASLPVHPWPLYSAAVALFLFAVLRRWHASPGRRSAIALVGYGGARFLLEFLRGDEQRVFGPLVVSQLICVVLVFIGAAVWLRTRNGVRQQTPAFAPALEAV